MKLLVCAVALWASTAVCGLDPFPREWKALFHGSALGDADLNELDRLLTQKQPWFCEDERKLVNVRAVASRRILEAGKQEDFARLFEKQADTVFEKMEKILNPNPIHDYAVRFRPLRQGREMLFLAGYYYRNRGMYFEANVYFDAILHDLALINAPKEVYTPYLCEIRLSWAQGGRYRRLHELERFVDTKEQIFLKGEPITEEQFKLFLKERSERPFGKGRDDVPELERWRAYLLSTDPQTRKRGLQLLELGTIPDLLGYFKVVPFRDLIPTSCPFYSLGESPQLTTDEELARYFNVMNQLDKDGSRTLELVAGNDDTVSAWAFKELEQRARDFERRPDPIVIEPKKDKEFAKRLKTSGAELRNLLVLFYQNSSRKSVEATLGLIGIIDDPNEESRNLIHEALERVFVPAPEVFEALTVMAAQEGLKGGLGVYLMKKFFPQEPRSEEMMWFAIESGRAAEFPPYYQNAMVLKHASLSRLLTALKHPDRRVRAATAKVLGNVARGPVNERYAEIVPSFMDKDITVASEVVDSLSTLGMNADVLQKGVVPYLENMECRVRPQLVRLLGTVHTDETQKRLIKLLSSDPELAVREDVLEVLSHWVAAGTIGVEDYRNIILSATKNSMAKIRFNAVSHIWQAGGLEQNVPLLIEMLGDEDQSVVRAATFQLRPAYGHHPEVRKAIADLVNHPGELARIGVIELITYEGIGAITGSPEEKEITAVALKFVDDPNEDVRKQLYSSLFVIAQGHADWMKVMKEGFFKETNPALRRAIVETLDNAEKDVEGEAIDLIFKAIEDPDESVRSFSQVALVKLVPNLEDLKERLMAMLKSSEPAVRFRAVTVAAFYKYYEKPLDPIRDQLKEIEKSDPDPAVRKAAKRVNDPDRLK